MIGVFDSGFGGLTILRVLVDRLPRYSYVYLGDNARMPFGSRTADDVFALTWHGVDYLFRRGCALVILACNTASAVCLRRIQQEELPAQYPDRRVLGIVVPTIEQITGVNWEVRKAVPVGQTDVRSVGVLATTQTVRSQAYPHEIRKRRPSIRVVQQACPRLAALIEAGAQQTKLRREIKKCLAALYQAAGNDIDAILLGCTHYALIADLIRAELPSGAALYEQPEIVAHSLAKYLTRHLEVVKRLEQSGRLLMLTSSDPAKVAPLASHYYGEPLSFQRW